MEGRYRVQIKTKRLQYDFTIQQKYTVIRGDSATGKTSLYRLLELAQRGIVQVSCQAACLPASALGMDWTSWLQTRQGSILFFDDPDDFVLTDAFAAAARASDNYFVFCNREPMPRIPGQRGQVTFWSRCTERITRPFPPAALYRRTAAPGDPISTRRCSPVRGRAKTCWFWQTALHAVANWTDCLARGTTCFPR